MQAQNIQNNYEIRKLTANETIAAFDCEDNDLNEFILVDAPLYRKALLATTYILTHKGTNKTIAYFSVANDRISIKDFPSNTAFNRFRKHPFYLKNDFTFLSDGDEGERTRLMYFDLADIL